MLGAIDLERGAKVSGSRFYFLTGVGADLELALVNMAMDQARDAGFTHGDPRRRWSSRARWRAPASSARPPTTSTGSRARTSTSSAPRRCRWRRTTPTRSSTATTLPLRYAAFSPCFRKEAGSHGKDTKRHHPGALVRQGRDVLLHDRRGVRTPSTSGCSAGRRSSSTSSSSPTASSTSRPATSACPPSASSTARRGSRPRASTASSPRPPTAPTSRPAGSTSAAASRTAGPSRSPRSTARSVAITAHHRGDPGDPPAGRRLGARCPQALRPYLQGREVLEPVA